MPRKTEGKLNDFASDEAENIKKQIEALIGQITSVMDDNKKLKERVDAMASLYGELHDTIVRVEEKTYPGDIANAIREFKDEFLKRSTVLPTVTQQDEEQPTPKVNHYPDVIEKALREANIDLNLIDMEFKGTHTIITPKRFLGDLWQPIMNAVKDLGGNWVKDGRNSRWEIGGAPASSEQAKDFTIKDPDSPATENQLAFLEKLKITPKPGITKGEASKLIDNKIGSKK